MAYFCDQRRSRQRMVGSEVLRYHAETMGVLLEQLGATKEGKVNERICYALQVYVESMDEEEVQPSARCASNYHSWPIGKKPKWIPHATVSVLTVLFNDRARFFDLRARFKPFVQSLPG